MKRRTRSGWWEFLRSGLVALALFAVAAGLLQTVCQAHDAYVESVTCCASLDQAPPATVPLVSPYAGKAPVVAAMMPMPASRSVLPTGHSLAPPGQTLPPLPYHSRSQRNLS